MTDDVKYTLALASINGVGLTSFRHLIASFGSAKDALSASAADLARLGSYLHSLARSIVNDRNDALALADKQLDKAARFNVNVLTINDPAYPSRLSQCPDAPPFLFIKGNVNFETAKVLSVVGTRRPTTEGRILTQRIVSDLCTQHPDIIIVSGLAYGIDVEAHNAALRSSRPTIGVVAHGLDTIYPAQHREVAAQIAKNGGAIISEFLFGVRAETYNFVARNRIIAGLADATLVTESALKGGSLITVRNAFDYNRSVFAVPGFPGRENSLGCNNLIKTNVAQLVECAQDIDRALGWELPIAARKSSQPSLFPEPQTDEERSIVATLRAEDGLTASVIGARTNIPIARVNVALLNMEFSGLVKSLPGNAYRLMN